MELNDAMQDFMAQEQTEASADDYRRKAEEMGLKVQPVVDSGNSTGAYYTVLAVYDGGVERIFGATPLALIFEDYSRAAIAVWLMILGDPSTDPQGEWQEGRWWRVTAPDGSLWCETSCESEAREAVRKGDTLERGWNFVPKVVQWRRVD